MGKVHRTARLARKAIASPSPLPANAVGDASLPEPRAASSPGAEEPASQLMHGVGHSSRRGFDFAFELPAGGRGCGLFMGSAGKSSVGHACRSLSPTRRPAKIPLFAQQQRHRALGRGSGRFAVATPARYPPRRSGLASALSGAHEVASSSFRVTCVSRCVECGEGRMKQVLASFGRGAPAT